MRSSRRMASDCLHLEPHRQRRHLRHPGSRRHARRITYSGGEVYWSPDGKYLVFDGRRDGVDPTLFATDVRTLRFQALFSDYRGVGYCSFSPDGKTVLYNRHGFAWTRPRYAGSAAAQVWAIELESGKRRGLTPPGRQHLWPRFLPDGQAFICVGTAEGDPSVSRLGETLPNVDNERRTPTCGATPWRAKASRSPALWVAQVRWLTVARRSGTSPSSMAMVSGCCGRGARRCGWRSAPRPTRRRHLPA